VASQTAARKMKHSLQLGMKLRRGRKIGVPAQAIVSVLIEKVLNRTAA
jgi:hypothetical protein